MKMKELGLSIIPSNLVLWREICLNQIVSVLHQESFKEFQAFICRAKEAWHKNIRERQVVMFNRWWLKSSVGHSKDSSSSSKDNGYMYSNFSGHSNLSLTDITTSTATTITPISTATASAVATTKTTSTPHYQPHQPLN